MKILIIVMMALLAGPLAACAAEPVSEPAPAPNSEVQALREAITLKQEGDRLQAAENPREARTKWLAALTAYERAGYRPGQVEVLFRIGTSYQPEMLDPKKQPLFLDAMMRGFIAASEHFRDGMPSEESGNRDPVRRGDALFTEAMKLAAAGDCKSAVPLFSQAGEVYRDAGSGKGEASSLAERLRCAAKAPDLFGVLQATQEVMGLGEKLKPRLRFKPAMRYMQAIDAEAAGKRDEAEKLYRSVVAAAAEDPQAAARAAFDLEGLLMGQKKPVAAEHSGSGEAGDSPAPKPAPRVPSIVAAGAGPIVVLDPRARAQREAAFALGEGDRSLQDGRLGEARKKWLAAAEGYRQAGNRHGVWEACQRLGASYASDALSDPRKLLLAVDYYSCALEAAAQIEEAESPARDGTAEKGSVLLEEASRLAAVGDCAQALPRIVEAMDLLRQAGRVAGLIRAAALKGRCETQRGDLQQAFLTIMEVLPTVDLPAARNPTSELVSKAEAFVLQGRHAEARPLYQEALCRYEAAKDFEGIADTLLALGAVQFALDDFREGESSLERGLGLLPVLASRGDSRYQEAAAHHNLGSAYAGVGRGAEAVAELQTALRLWKELGEVGNEAGSLSALGGALRLQGDYPGALAALDQGEHLQEHLSPNPELEGDLEENRGAVYYSQGRFREAFDAYAKALEAYRRMATRTKEAQLLNNLGTLEDALGNFAQALSRYREAREAGRQTGSEILQVKIGVNEARTLVQAGDYQSAVAAYLRLLPRVRAFGDSLTEAALQTGLGAAYFRIGDLDGGLACFDEAFAILHRLGSSHGVATALLDQGYLLLQAGRREAGEQRLREALRIWTELGDEAMATHVRVDLALGEVSGGSLPAERLQKLVQMREAASKAGFSRDALRFSLLIGDAQLEQDDRTAALESARQIIAEAQRTGDPNVEFGGRALAIMVRSLQGNLEEAERELKGLLPLVDRWQRGLTLSEYKSRFLDQFSALYILGALANAEVGRSEEAFRFAEQARARAFLDQLGNQRLEVGRGADSDLIRQEGELRARLARLAVSVQQENVQSHEDRVQSLKAALEQARSDYAALLIRLKLSNPEMASLVSVETLSLHEVQQVLDEKTTLIEYLAPSLPAGAGGATKVLAWVIDHEHSSMVKLPVLVDDLRNRVTELRNLIAVRQPVDRQTAELYRDLFAPLAPHVRHRNLIIVPHGVLHSLPFAGLWDEANRRYLGDAYALSYSPSATVLKFAREKKAPAVGPILVAGNPDGSLAAAASEARAVARLYDGEPLLGRAATEGAVVARAGQAGILNLAAHADLNPINPLFTRVKLAPDGEHDGNLEMHEVFALNLSKTGLVVLSACSTQMGNLTGGDELDGLTRAFLYAGTPAVMASLWDVQDESTSFFMERFYTHLRKEVGRAEALRLAQMETRKRFPHPYQWAAFVLTGDGR